MQSDLQFLSIYSLNIVTEDEWRIRIETTKNKKKSRIDTSNEDSLINNILHVCYMG